MKYLDSYNIYTGSIDKLVDRVIENEENIHIISGNPEVLYNCSKYYEIGKNLRDDNHIVIPDGIGVVALLRKRGIEAYKLTGIDLFNGIIHKLDKSNINKRIYLLGAKDTVIKDLVEELSRRYKNLNITGYHNGYIDIDNCDDVINDINQQGVDMLFVAMGSPKQELFITRYMNDLSCNTFMGVGGTFDVVSGNVRRAPSIFLKMNLEWIYRAVTNPYRIKKMCKMIKFVLREF